MMKSKASAAISLILVFVSGALLGVLAHRAYVVRSASSNSVEPRKLTPADWRRHNLAEMRSRLKLDDKQTAELDAVFDKVDDDFRKLGAKRRAEDQASPATVTDRAKRNLADSRTKLGLNEQQLGQVNQIIDQAVEDTRQVFIKRRAEDQAYQLALVDKINAILRPDQQVLYKEYRDERERERQRRRMQGQGPGGPGGPPPMGGPGGPGRTPAPPPSEKK